MEGIEDDRLEDQISRLAVLSEPMRRALYLYVIGHGGDVGRDEAARDLHITRALAAFHLEKLVEEGLLDVTYRRLTGRAGPGAGRPAKLYRRSARQIEVTLPQRRYELAARLLARAVTEARSTAAARSLSKLAGDLGSEIGAEARRRAGRRTGQALLLKHAVSVLADYGFEPVIDARGEILLRNCPFDALARESRDLVCGMNLALMEGLVRGLGARGIAARLDPKPNHCCVVIGPKSSDSSARP